MTMLASVPGESTHLSVAELEKRVRDQIEYKLLKEGKINGMKVGRTYRIPKVHVLEYMKIVDRKPPLSTTALPAAE